MARKRPTASNVKPPELICLDGGLSRMTEPVLSRAEARALQRSAALTHEQLRQHLTGIPQPPVREA